MFLNIFRIGKKVELMWPANVTDIRIGSHHADVILTISFTVSRKKLNKPSRRFLGAQAAKLNIHNLEFMSRL